MRRPAEGRICPPTRSAADSTEPVWRQGLVMERLLSGSWELPKDRGGPGCIAGDPLRSQTDQSRWLLADAEPKDGDAFRLRAAERLQVYPTETRGGEPDAVAEQHRQDIHLDLVHESPPQALTGHVGAEDLQVLAARGLQRRGDRLPDVTGEVRDIRLRRV